LTRHPAYARRRQRPEPVRPPIGAHTQDGLFPRKHCRDASRQIGDVGDVAAVDANCDVADTQTGLGGRPPAMTIADQRAVGVARASSAGPWHGFYARRIDGEFRSSTIASLNA
jgi:hypothetical protein